MEAATIPATTLDRRAFEDLRALIGGGSLASLVELFSERADTIDALVSAGHRGQVGKLVRITHSLKGGASSLAATRLAELAAELERRVKDGDLDGASVLAEETAVEFDRAIAAMCEALETAPTDEPMTQGVRRTPAA